MRYWGSFVKHGNPAAPGLTAWPSLRAGKYMSLLPGGASRALKTDVFEARRQCAFWNSLGYDWLPVNPDQLAAQAGCFPVLRPAAPRARLASGFFRSCRNTWPC